MLRSDSPDRPMFVRRRHWLTHETRFLFLTRKGPVEIIVKPGVIIGAAVVGSVGTSVIAATTLFLGFKSVEVVRNESITTAEANMPTILSGDGQGGAWPDPLGLDSRLSESGQLDIDRERGADPVGIDEMRAQPLGFEENLVGLLVC